MTISDTMGEQVFVWIWLPGSTDPVVAGRLDRDGSRLVFTYGASYRRRADAIPLYEPELPLKEGRLSPMRGLEMPGCVRDGVPDAWGRRVIINRWAGACARDVHGGSGPAFFLHSGSDRIGALDFQASATEYVARLPAPATLDQLVEAAALIETGRPLPPALSHVLESSTAVGGARPKALLEDGGAVSSRNCRQRATPSTSRRPSSSR